jgi:hypothetical protein
MNKDKLKNFTKIVLEPFAFGLLALLFIIPAITVINLEPVTKTLKDLDVLGITNKSELQVNVVGGSHMIFRSEKIQFNEDVYTYTTTLTRRESDRYSKPILEIINNKQEEISLDIYGSTKLPTASDITMIIDNQVYRLQNPKGEANTQKITFLPNKKYLVYIAVENFSDVQFDEEFELTIKEIK